MSTRCLLTAPTSTDIYSISLHDALPIFRLRRIRSCYAMCLPATSQACHDFSFFFADKKPVRQMEERGRYHQDKVERRYHQNKKILIPFIQKGNHSIPISSLISIQCPSGSSM